MGPERGPAPVAERKYPGVDGESRDRDHDSWVDLMPGEPRKKKRRKKKRKKK